MIAIYNERTDGNGSVAAINMKIDIQEAEKAISTGDVMEMLICFKKLKEYEKFYFSIHDSQSTG